MGHYLSETVPWIQRRICYAEGHLTQSAYNIAASASVKCGKNP